mgnify:CR=1 FL=1
MNTFGYKVGDKFPQINEKVLTTASNWGIGQALAEVAIFNVCENKIYGFIEHNNTVFVKLESPNYGGVNYWLTPITELVRLFGDKTVIKELPEKFYIVRGDRTPQNNKLWGAFIKWLNNKYNFRFDGDRDECYGISHGVVISGCMRNLTYIEPITLEEWGICVGDFTEKEIVGYKLIDDKYREAAMKITTQPSSTSWNENLKDYGWMFTYKSFTAEKLRDVGVLDLWFEPVYAQDNVINITLASGKELAITKEGVSTGNRLIPISEFIALKERIDSAVAMLNKLPDVGSHSTQVGLFHVTYLIGCVKITYNEISDIINKHKEVLA